jgi:drug/metabolite transporter (DMT)-like permease
MLIVASGSSSGTGDLKGDLLAVVAVLISSGYFVFSKKALLTVPLIEFQAGVFAWGGLVLIPMVIASQASLIAPSNADLGRIFMVALIPMGGHLLLNYSHGKAPLNLIAVFQLIVPVISTILAYWILSQSVTSFQGIGMAIVIITLGINSYFKPNDEDNFA